LFEQLRAVRSDIARRTWTGARSGTDLAEHRRILRQRRHREAIAVFVLPSPRQLPIWLGDADKKLKSYGLIGDAAWVSPAFK